MTIQDKIKKSFLQALLRGHKLSCTEDPCEKCKEISDKLEELV